ncbi:glycosyltransferase family 4 protein [Variovorax sp. W2I14]|uniref:glycosyltransferase family 4 protein n=1 Tax=Variovorax sp. W2I14 TaxID=3042290 RepID=UPI003D2017A3
MIRVRLLAKGLWWLMTPWLLPRRVLARQQNQKAAYAEVLRNAPYVEGLEFVQASLARVRPAATSYGPGGTGGLLPLLLDAAAGDPDFLSPWPPQASSEIDDAWSAARWCIDMARLCPEFHGVLPRLSVEGGPASLRWTPEGEAALASLSLQARACVEELLRNEPASRARQTFLFQSDIRALLPHGLTPAGWMHLLPWFIRYGRPIGDLRQEEIWWLFLEAAQDPCRELMLAHAFTPPWQQRHPDGTTIFGRDEFATWFASEYGACGDWLDASHWPEWDAPASQIMNAYWTRAHWRAAHPDAFANVDAARSLVTWLASSESALPPALRVWCNGLDIQAVSSELAKPGANVIGHFCYPSGLRVSVESLVRAVGLEGVPTSLRDVRTDAKDDPCHIDFRGMECHDITIIHVQPEPLLTVAYDLADIFERAPRTYRIGYWYWEFDSIPDAWMTHAQNVDEVWAATEFVARGLRERLSIPVRTLFPGVQLASYDQRDKAHFGLNETPFTFLFVFHMMSVMERKNPLGLIRAFREAFRENEAVSLVLKTSFGDRHPEQFERLQEAAAGSNIVLINEVYTPDRLLSLMDACDAYVSLHRSEGLGLTMAEAMLMGKPVIATNFSGNVDFMDADNSLLVSYQLVKLGQPIPPYDAELEWAEPSIEHAAQLMRRVYENQDWARQLGARAKESAEKNLSLKVAGKKIVKRLEEIKAIRRSST